MGSRTMLVSDHEIRLEDLMSHKFDVHGKSGLLTLDYYFLDFVVEIEDSFEA